MSTSVDWTVKLWKTREGKNSLPLACFDEFDDYVLDCAWSPTHPGMFACVDATAKLSVYNLNQEIEVPVTSIQAGCGSLNKVAWSGDGKNIAVGGNNGMVYIYDIGEYGNLSANDSGMFGKFVGDIQSEVLR